MEGVIDVQVVQHRKSIHPDINPVQQCLTSVNRREPLVLAWHGVGFRPTIYEQCLHLSEWLSDTFAYRSPRKNPVSTLRVSTSLKRINHQMLVLESFVWLCVSFSFHFKLDKSLHNASLSIGRQQRVSTCFIFARICYLLEVRGTNYLSEEFDHENIAKKLMLLTCTLFFVYSACVSSGSGTI